MPPEKKGRQHSAQSMLLSSFFATETEMRRIALITEGSYKLLKVTRIAQQLEREREEGYFRRIRTENALNRALSCGDQICDSMD